MVVMLSRTDFSGWFKRPLEMGTNRKVRGANRTPQPGAFFSCLLSITSFPDPPCPTIGFHITSSTNQTDTNQTDTNQIDQTDD